MDVGGEDAGVCTPPEMKLSSSYINVLAFKFFISPSVTSFLRGAPLLRKILDPPLKSLLFNMYTAADDGTYMNPPDALDCSGTER